MKHIVAETRFDCRDRDGNDFTAHLMIGDLEPCVVRDGVAESKLLISLDPLFPERGFRGTDSFHAICLAIELVRKALRAFVVHGGTVYYHGTKTPIDIDDYAFTPINEPIDERFLAGLASTYARVDDEPEHRNGG
ncbi:hypothetical protein [Crateriforma spongiae]|uniref:hypothetical protein n=1 Tax=Crateriforma spongiae TaxID=2724528 RepID=UPI001446BAC8|nr:hypothetical protein [Crateriforma spongiae]